jgi:PPM family protein phosphatase
VLGGSATRLFPTAPCLVPSPAALPVTTDPLRNLLAESGYSVCFRSDLWTECFASHERERWRGRGLDEDDALADVLRQMFPSSFAQRLLAEHPVSSPPARPPLGEAPSSAPPVSSPPAHPPLGEAPSSAPEAPVASPLAHPPLREEASDVDAAPPTVASPASLAPTSSPVSRSPLITAAARTDRGLVRERNEDACLAFGERGLVAVADGVGPHPGADVASTLAIETLRRAFEGEAPLSPLRRKGLPLLLAAIDEANVAIVETGRRDRAQRGKGTTLAAALVVGRQVALAHVGDSRIYRLRRGVLELLTTDHSKSNDRLRSTSKAAKAPATSTPNIRSEVTRAVGARRTVEVDTSVVTSQPGDVLLLCTAGLHGVVAHQKLAELLVTHADPAVAVDHLVALANAQGGPDNVTAAVVRWER